MSSPASSDFSFASPSFGSPLFNDVFELGESQSRFVGMLPPSAWRDYAAKGLLLALVGRLRADGSKSPERLLGYAAFRLPRNEVVLAHLVVAPQARGGGVARQLVEELSRLHAGRTGIAARCRRDFPANKMWPHLGFVARGDRPGRSAAGHHLTDWWRDHGHSHLMTWEGPVASMTPVVADANVFIDLHAQADTELGRRTKRILEEVLEGRIQLLVTPELLNDIDRNDDLTLRHQLRSVINSYPELRVAPALFEQAQVSLLAGAKRQPRSPQDWSDVRHVAYAAAAGVCAVVTRDNPALRDLSSAASLLGVSLVTPEELVLFVDQNEDAPSYTPVALLGTGYEVREARTSDLDALSAFFDHGTGERKTHYLERLRHLAGQRERSAHRRLFTDPAGGPVALLGTAPTDDALEVTLLRMRPSAVGATLAAQVVAGIRAVAADARRNVIRVTDPHPHPLLSDALSADGFRVVGSGAVAVTLPGTTTLAALKSSVQNVIRDLSSAERAALDPLLDAAGSLAANAAPADVASIERQLRPLRVVDSPLPCWIVPIQPKYSTQLFGYPEELFPRIDDLGISIEHVYYRKGKSGEGAPGRVLWYVSGTHYGVLIGCSDLVEVIDEPPEQLWRRFRRLGVYTRRQVQGSASKQGTARALRVVNTELWPRHVSLTQLRRAASRHSQRLQLQSPCRVSAALVADLLQEGHDG